MQLHKYRWSKNYESAEEELLKLLDTQRVIVPRHDCPAGASTPTQACLVDTHVWCAEGSMVLNVSDQRFSLQPGDTLDIPAQTTYSLQAGMTGCVYYINM